jgi:hypothetical protein
MDLAMRIGIYPSQLHFVFLFFSQKKTELMIIISVGKADIKIMSYTSNETEKVAEFEIARVLVVLCDVSEHVCKSIGKN